MTRQLMCLLRFSSMKQGWEKQAGFRIDDDDQDKYEEALSLNFAGLGLVRRMSEGGNEDDDSQGGIKEEESEEHRFIRWLLATADQPGGERDIDEMVIGLTTYDENAEPEPGIESVLIPNRSKNQYIRQTTSNGRKCVFQLDAFAAPKNSTAAADGKKGSKESATIVGEDGKEEDRLKWIQGE